MSSASKYFNKLSGLHFLRVFWRGLLCAMVWIQHICLYNVSLGPLPPICFPYSNPDLIYWLTCYGSMLANELFTFQVCIFVRLTPAVVFLVDSSLFKRVILDCHLEL